MEEYGGWPMFSKFFDNHAPLLIMCTWMMSAARVGALGKPEAYYFRPTSISQRVCSLIPFRLKARNHKNR